MFFSVLLIVVVSLHGRHCSYIKEFVHGDFGRTKPNLCDLMKTDADILELDVEVRLMKYHESQIHIISKISNIPPSCLCVFQSVDVDWPPAIPDWHSGFWE